MLWWDIWCYCGRVIVVVIIVGKVVSVSFEDIIQWVIIIWDGIIDCMDGMGVGGEKGCDQI